jgi:hypothetical protein
MAIDPAPWNETNLHSFNRYAFANNNPMRFVDPDGREAEELPQRFGDRYLRPDPVAFQKSVDEMGDKMAASAKSAASEAGQFVLIAAVTEGLGPLIKLAKSLRGSSAAAEGTAVLATLLAPRMVQHHIFNVFRGGSQSSQKYRDFFRKHGIKVDEHTVFVSEKKHLEIHAAGNNWTTRWKKWIDDNPNATTKDVYQQAGKMMDDYGINDRSIVPYK